MIVTTTPASTSSRHMMVRMKNTDVAKFWNSRNSISAMMKTIIDTAWLAIEAAPVDVDFRISTKKKPSERMTSMSPEVTGHLVPSETIEISQALAGSLICCAMLTTAPAES